MDDSVDERRLESDKLRMISTLEELADLVAGDPLVYLRYSHGPEADAADGPSRDYEADVTLPGLSVTTIAPEPWWPRPSKEWVARRICKYGELGDEEGRYAWLLTGTVVGRGPDHEPLLTDIRPLARLSRTVLDEATQLYYDRFEVGKDSRRGNG